MASSYISAEKTFFFCKFAPKLDFIKRSLWYHLMTLKQKSMLNIFAYL